MVKSDSHKSRNCHRAQRDRALTDAQWQRVFNKLQAVDPRAVLGQADVSSMRLDDYARLMGMRGEPCKPDFQNLFTSYYNLRCSEAYRKEYYRLFAELCKAKDPDIESALKGLMHLRSGVDHPSVELSFASKMIATVCPERPLWDKRVKKAFNDLGLRWRDHGTGEFDVRMQKAVSNYHLLEDLYDMFFESGIGDVWVAAFDEVCPGHGSDIGKTKKIDFILWCMGK